MTRKHETEENRERRLRRLAARDGYRIEKSRQSGTYHVVGKNGLAFAGNYASGFGLDLDDVEEWLTGDEE